jgi:hypothetical protein
VSETCGGAAMARSRAYEFIGGVRSVLEERRRSSTVL